MARQWRIQFEGAIYHIMCRGIERGMILLDDEDYLRFLGYIQISHQRELRDKVKSILLSTFKV